MTMLAKLVFSGAILLTAIALVPAGAHVLEMPAKLRLDQRDYFVAQSIYRGWALFGIVLVAAIAADIGAAWLSVGRTVALSLWISAGLLLIASLAVFFLWTQPANRITANWTIQPANWEVLRQQWEYAHAAGAGLTLLSLGCAVAAAMIGAGKAV